MSLGPPHGPTGPIAMAGKDTPNPQKGTPSSNPCYLKVAATLKSLLPLSPHQNFQPKDLCSLHGGQTEHSMIILGGP